MSPQVVEWLEQGGAAAVLGVLFVLVVFLWLKPWSTGEPSQGEPEDLGWFRISFDDATIHLDVSPPDRTPWSADVPWDKIIRVVYEVEEWPVSDGIYLFVGYRPQSYVIPIDGAGGAEFWEEIIHRGLFDANLALEASSCATPRLFTWPPDK